MKTLLFKAGFQNMIPSIVQDTSAVTEELLRYRESILGPIRMVPQNTEDSLQTGGQVNLCIYAVTSGANQHKSNQLYHSHYVKYIQAGAKLTSTRLCSLTDADVILAAIDRVQPEYIVSAERFFSEKLFCGGNIVLARKEIYNGYYDWMFQVIRECEKIYKETGRQSTPRLWGYAGELLTNIFFMHHIREYQVMFSFMKNLY